MSRQGVGSFVEIGPGKVLTGLIKRIAPDAQAFALDDQSAPGGIAVPDFYTTETTGATS
jgi:malonyl CoA-acyl carrier protein transacylase